MKAGRIVAAGGSALLLAFGLDLVSARRQLIDGRRTVDDAFAHAELALGQRAGAMAGFEGAVAGNLGLERTPIDAMLERAQAAGRGVKRTRNSADLAAPGESVMRELLQSRASAMGARTRSEKIAADERVERALARLPLLEETHPDLRLSENLGNIENVLATAESHVAIARGTYNNAVLRYNASLASFPRNIAARIFGFRQENDYFKPDTGSESSKLYR
jgi:hypothetical protein